MFITEKEACMQEICNFGAIKWKKSSQKSHLALCGTHSLNNNSYKATFNLPIWNHGISYHFHIHWWVNNSSTLIYLWYFQQNFTFYKELHSTKLCKILFQEPEISFCVFLTNDSCQNLQICHFYCAHELLPVKRIS